MGFPGGSDSKASACNAGDLGSIPGLGRSPGEGKWQPTPVLLPRKFNGWRSLVGYSLWGPKELTSAVLLNLSFSKFLSLLAYLDLEDLQVLARL